uniref:Uncharacterized protein n=1 Tax=viral metagenome TaxID=1070528 RepID=A0A6H1ZHJ8_9ZZZZ
MIESLVLSSKHICSGTIGINCPGNDGFGHKLKLVIDYPNNDGAEGFDREIQDLLEKYFEQILFFNIKGNLIVYIKDGKFKGIQSEFYVQVDSPRIFTGNKIVQIMKKGGFQDGNDKR